MTTEHFPSSATATDSQKPSLEVSFDAMPDGAISDLMDEALQTRSPKTLAETTRPFSFLELLTGLGQEKKLLILVPLFCGIATLITSFFLTPIYTAETVAMPPQQNQSGASALMDQVGGLASLALGGGMVTK